MPAARPVPSAADRHLLKRFSYGITPALTDEVYRLGGADQWFSRQLNHKDISDGYANGLRDWFPALDKTPQQLWHTDQTGGQQGFEVTADYERWTMLRRAYSKRQVQETMVEFWANLLHIPCPEAKSWPHRVRYDTTLRQHALGRFDDMVVACVLHPAMLLYLDNAVSQASNINENLGREVLELHTVGVAGDYTEDEVQDSARILTGYRVDAWETWTPYYAEEDHFRGQVSVLGFSDPNPSYNGRDLTKRYLRYLATHPVTARRIARRLCVRFISDDPSPAVVDAVTAAFVQSGTDIKQTLRALVAHPEFAASAGDKTRTPTQDAIATYRALGLEVMPPSKKEDFAYSLLHQVNSMGQQPFGWVRPDGFPDVADAWTSISRMLGSWRAHWGLAGGYWPKSGVRHRTMGEWLPALPARFDEVVDHISRLVLAKPASKTHQRAVTAFTTIQPFERIRTPSDLPEYKLVQLLSVLLDSPAHMTR